MRVCCNMISDNHIAYGSRVSLQGITLPFSRNHSSIATVKLTSHRSIDGAKVRKIVEFDGILPQKVASLRNTSKLIILNLPKLPLYKEILQNLIKVQSMTSVRVRYDFG